jgi:hypothetical protein
MSTRHLLLMLTKSVTNNRFTYMFKSNMKVNFVYLIIFHPKTVLFVIMVALDLSDAINGILIAYVTYD